MLQFIRRKLKSERGQSLIEFAALFPVILVFLLLMVDFGIAVDHRLVIQHAVREGARQGAVGLSEDAVKDLVFGQSQDILAPADVEVCYADGPDGEPAGTAGSRIRVSGTHTYKFGFGGELLGAFGVDESVLTVEMTPSGEANMETSVSGATECAS